MELHIIWTFIITQVIAIVGLFGWSHRTLRSRLQEMEKELLRRPTESQMRTLIADKLAPQEVEYAALSRRIQELYVNQKELDNKLDKIIQIISRK